MNKNLFSESTAPGFIYPVTISSTIVFDDAATIDVLIAPDSATADLSPNDKSAVE
jgi:hypothetical protein